MLTRIFTHMTLWLWLLSVSVASVGVSIYEVYCYCLDRTQVALFDIEDECATKDTNAELFSCCTAKAKACPLEEPQIPACCTSESTEQDHNCTEKTVRVFKLNTKYLVEHFDMPDFDLYLHQDIGIAVWDIDMPVPQEQAIPAPPRPPPPLSGRDICIRHELFLC